MAARQVMLVSSHVFLPLSDRQSYIGNILRLMPLRVNNQMCRRTVQECMHPLGRGAVDVLFRPLRP
jgi:hypothetical protein